MALLYRGIHSSRPSTSLSETHMHRTGDTRELEAASELVLPVDPTRDP